MHTFFKYSLIGLLAFAGLQLFNQTPADACGGFFCNQQAVTQTGEQIIFAVDEENNSVQVDIQIAYSGLAADFAWLLPLSEAPTSIDTGSTQAFQILDRLTRPQFSLRREERGMCRQNPPPNFPSGGVFDTANVSHDGGADSSVIILQRSKVGPYDSVVLSSSDPQDVREWLEQNEYRVTDEMMDAVVPYISKGDVLLALRLLKDASSGEIQPISLDIPGNELCIPLRLTAIAAQDDMDVTAYAFSNRGRAVPTNYLHFEPNWTRLDWLRFGQNYQQLVGDAADEAGGNAFTTEFAGPTSELSAEGFGLGQFAHEQLYRQENLLSLVQYLRGTNLNFRSEFQAILRGLVTDDDLVEAGLDPTAFWRCPSCYRAEVERYAPFNAPAFQSLVAQPLFDAVEERIVEPERRMLNTFRTRSYLTRLFTLISPDEMGLDPIFDFRENLPDIKRLHSATLVTTCDAAGDITRRHLELEDDSIVELDVMSTMPASTLNQMPAVAIVSDFSAGKEVVLVDNRAKIKEMAALPAIKIGACSCGVAEKNGTLAGLGLAVFGLLFLRRRRR
jgi:MYXO-CTERM domain-containing protein